MCRVYVCIQGYPIPTEPIIFNKTPSTVSHPGDDIELCPLIKARPLLLCILSRMSKPGLLYCNGGAYPLGGNLTGIGKTNYNVLWGFLPPVWLIFHFIYLWPKALYLNHCVMGRNGGAYVSEVFLVVEALTDVVPQRTPCAFCTDFVSFCNTLLACLSYYLYLDPKQALVRLHVFHRQNAWQYFYIPNSKQNPGKKKANENEGATIFFKIKTNNITTYL